MARRLLLAATALTMLIIISGCVAAAAAGAAGGAGTYAWMSGKLTFTTAHSITEAHTAAISAFKDLSIEVASDQTSTLSGKIKGTAANGESVAVDLEPLSPTITKIDVRAGFWGNQYQESKIADAIQRHLR